MTSLKRDKVCPQCEHRKLWHIERVALPVRMPGFRKRFFALGVGMESEWTGYTSEFESFICGKCGFAEWYATNLEHLQPDPTNGVHFVDAEPKAGLR